MQALRLFVAGSVSQKGQPSHVTVKDGFGPVDCDSSHDNALQRIEYLVGISHRAPVRSLCSKDSSRKSQR